MVPPGLEPGYTGLQPATLPIELKNRGAPDRIRTDFSALQERRISHLCFKGVERVAGLEPALSTWKDDVQPYTPYPHGGEFGPSPGLEFIGRSGYRQRDR